MNIGDVLFELDKLRHSDVTSTESKEAAYHAYRMITAFAFSRNMKHDEDADTLRVRAWQVDESSKEDAAQSELARNV